MKSCVSTVLRALLITMVVEDVLGIKVTISIEWGAKKRRRDIGDVTYKLHLPCGIEKYDDNNDGYLDLDEFAKAANGHRDHPGLTAGFNSLDKDGDSKLSIEEQIDAMPDHCAKQQIEAIIEKAKKADP